MEIVQNKALKLKLRNPQRVIATVPKSKVVAELEDGSFEVLVHWGIEEAQVLKNLQIKNVPSPSSLNTNGPALESRLPTRNRPLRF